jgi:hypothetical protein
MNCARDQFFSGPGLSCNEDGGVCGATFATCPSSWRSAGEEPMISSNIEE